VFVFKVKIVLLFTR